MNPTAVGNRSEAAVLAALVACGHLVLLPFGGGARYDLVIDDRDGQLRRVQVKTARRHRDALSFRTCSQTGGGSQPYHDQVDAFGVHDPVSGRCFLVPADKAPSLNMHLRLAPARNGQTKGVHWAADYELRPAPPAVPATASAGPPGR